MTKFDILSIGQNLHLPVLDKIPLKWTIAALSIRDLNPKHDLRLLNYTNLDFGRALPRQGISKLTMVFLGGQVIASRFPIDLSRFELHFTASGELQQWLSPSRGVILWIVKESITYKEIFNDEFKCQPANQ